MNFRLPIYWDILSNCHRWADGNLTMSAVIQMNEDKNIWNVDSYCLKQPRICLELADNRSLDKKIQQNFLFLPSNFAWLCQASFDFQEKIRYNWSHFWMLCLIFVHWIQDIIGEAIETIGMIWEIKLIDVSFTPFLKFNYMVTRIYISKRIMIVMDTLMKKLK